MCCSGTLALQTTTSEAVGLCSQASILRVEDALRAPLDSALSRRVEGRLRSGHRRVVLDLARLADIDAAGIGELMRAFQMTNAAGGVLQIARANRRVRHLLQVAGVFALLTVPSDPGVANAGEAGTYTAA
jgi:anti-anti-sigma factor